MPEQKQKEYIVYDGRTIYNADSGDGERMAEPVRVQQAMSAASFGSIQIIEEGETA